MTRPRTKDRHLPACMYLRHGAHYYVKDGVWTRLPAKGPSTLSAALEAYARLVESPQGTVPALIDEALTFLSKDIAASTATQYARAAKKLKKYLAEFAPEQVKQKHAAAIKVSLQRIPNMANRVITVGRLIFNYALEHERIEWNPFVGITRYKERKRTRLPSIAEYDAIYAKAGPRLRIIMALLRSEGQRIVDTLRIRRVDLLPEGIAFEQQKTGKRIIVKWTPELRQAVDDARALYGENVVSLTLLRNRKGKAPDYRTVADQFRKAAKAAGVEDIRPHDLRAMAGTHAKKQGKDPQALLGHASRQNTERYLRDREPELVEGPDFGRPLDTGTK